VAKLPSPEEARCQDWEALKRALAGHKDIAYQIGRRELHVWTRDPEPGQRCQCGARRW